jgi:hypothetical protein
VTYDFPTDQDLSRVAFSIVPESADGPAGAISSEITRTVGERDLHISAGRDCSPAGRNRFAAQPGPHCHFIPELCSHDQTQAAERRDVPLIVCDDQPTITQELQQAFLQVETHAVWFDLTH